MLIKLDTLRERLHGVVLNKGEQGHNIEGLQEELDSLSDSYDEFVNFIQNIVRNDNLLITTGLINFDLIQKLKEKFLNKKSDKIYYNDFLNNSIYLVFHLYLINQPGLSEA